MTSIEDQQDIRRLQKQVEALTLKVSALESNKTNHMTDTTKLKGLLEWIEDNSDAIKSVDKTHHVIYINDIKDKIHSLLEEEVRIPSRDYKLFPGGKKAAQEFNKQLELTKNIYTILEEIDFEKSCKHSAKVLQVDIALLTQIIFSYLQKFYEKLDASSQPSAGNREIEFAEWILKNDYVEKGIYTNNNKIWWNGGVNKSFTSSQLYQLFLTQTGKPQE